MAVDLKPSFPRTLATFVVPVGGILALAYVLGSGARKLTIFEIGCSTMLLALLAITVWIFCVPRHLEFSETELTIKPALGRLQTLEWNELEYFGPAGGIFLLQFAGRSPFMVFTFAFRRAEWLQLKRFLYDTFPECISSGHIAGHLFRWRK